MTDYSVTISEEIRSFGGGPTAKWNEVTWNSFKWGAGTLNVLHDVEHYIPESQATTDYRVNTLDKYTSETANASDGASIAMDFVLGTISESFTWSDALGAASRMDRTGTYTYTRAAQTSFTQTSANSTSWTETVPISTTWTEDT